MHLLAQVSMMDPTIFFKHKHDRMNRDGYKSYVCHTAVMHWALVAAGKTHQQAEEVIAALVRKLESRAGLITDPWMLVYGPLITSKAGFAPLPEDMLRQHCGIGDVVIIGSAANPGHSMVVVSHADNKVWVRGFNNTGTFRFAAIQQNLPDPPFNAYDKVSRDLSTRLKDSPNPPILLRTTPGHFIEAVKKAFYAEVGATF